MSSTPVATISILLHGNGRMTESIRSVAARTDSVLIRGTLDLREGRGLSTLEDGPGARFGQIPDRISTHDVVIDFTRSGAVGPLIDTLSGSGLRLVCGTTALTDSERSGLREYAKEAAVFYDENMSYGISLLKLLLEVVSKRRGDFHDVEIVELHHRGKVDRPSGTALALSRLLSAPTPPQDADGASSRDGYTEIPIQSLRIGGVPGEHHVHFGSEEEVLTLSHRALTRDVFARGALRAARFVCGKETGLFTMKDLVQDKSV